VGGDTYCGAFAGACDGCPGKGGYCDVFVSGYDGVSCGCKNLLLLQILCKPLHNVMKKSNPKSIFETKDKAYA